MVKAMQFVAVLSLLASVVLLASCQTSGMRSTQEGVSDVAGSEDWQSLSAADRQDVKIHWSKRMPGLVTDLDQARETKDVLLALVPDTDRSGTIGVPQLWYLTQEGRVKFQKNLSSRVKSQAVTPDGSWIFVSTYDEKLRALNSAGRTQWEIQDFCRPYPLAKTRRVLCVFDDESRSGVAFDVIDENGKKILSHPIKRDLLAFAVSPDEKYFAYALTLGEVVVLGSDFKPLANYHMGGEVVDLIFSESGSPKLAVLYNENIKKGHSRRVSQTTALIDPVTKSKRDFPVELFGEKIAISHDEQMLYLYGNNPLGQSLSAWTLVRGNGSGAKLKWQRSEPRPADFTSVLAMSRGAVIAGFENVRFGSSPQNLLLGFDREGRVRWKIDLDTKKGAYLYVNRFSVDRNSLVIVTDEGDVIQYEIR